MLTSGLFFFFQQNEMVGTIIYFLHMTFVLMVMPEFAQFSFSAQLWSTWVGIGKYEDATEYFCNGSFHRNDLC